jgi:xanthine dehydrogenase accessory factor
LAHHKRDLVADLGEFRWFVVRVPMPVCPCVCAWAGDNAVMAASLSAFASKAQVAGVPFALVIVAAARGSTPRERGASMVVTGDGLAGTIGGGKLEFDAIADARALLYGGLMEETRVVALGPETGQCCGGSVTITIRRGLSADIESLRQAEIRADARRPCVFIYGAGHVGRALARALLPLPFDVTLVDSRAEELARIDAQGLRVILSEQSGAIAAQAPSWAAHVVMTHSHGLDSLIAASILERGDFAYLGIIGSATKRALFLKAFRQTDVPEDMISRITCPIGGVGVRDKRPEVIAAMTAAEITRALLGGADGG